MEKWALQKNKCVDFKPRDLPSAGEAEEPNAGVRPAPCKNNFARVRKSRVFLFTLVANYGKIYLWHGGKKHSYGRQWHLEYA